MTTTTMYLDFIKAQKEFEPARKDSINPFHKSKYADLSVCIDAVKDALNNNNFALIQKTHDYETGVGVETILMHSSGESISGGILRLPASKQDPQGYGACLTYCRRYSLMAVCGIAPEDDDGNSAKILDHVISKPLIDNRVDQLREAQDKQKQKIQKEEKEKLIQAGMDAASVNMGALELWWKSLSDYQKNLMKDEKDNLKKLCHEGVS